MRDILGAAFALGCAALAAGAPATAAAAETVPRVRLEVISTIPADVPILGDAVHGISERTARASDGEVIITFRQPEEWGKAPAALRAIGEGKLQAGWASAGWLSDDDSAFGLYYAIPFGPSVGEYLAWLYKGGGLEISHDLFHRRGIHGIPCVLLPPSGAGWFRKPVNTFEDLKGLRVRSFSLGERVLQKAGVQTRGLPVGDVIAAMRNGEVDAVEFLLPAIDRTFKFSTVAPYYYFPSWHKQTTIFYLFVNRDLWQGLAERDRSLLETICSEAMMQSLVAGEAMQWQVMRQFKAEGIQLRRFPPDVLIGLEKAWGEVVAEESARNPNFKRVYDSYAAFRENYALWRYFSPLN